MAHRVEDAFDRVGGAQVFPVHWLFLALGGRASWRELTHPDTDRSSDDDAALGQKILNIAEAHVKSEIRPDGITDHRAREAVAFEAGWNVTAFHCRSLCNPTEFVNVSMPLDQFVEDLVEHIADGKRKS